MNLVNVIAFVSSTSQATEVTFHALIRVVVAIRLPECSATHRHAVCSVISTLPILSCL